MVRVEGILEMNCGVTYYLELGIIFRLGKKTKKNLLPTSALHCCTNKQLDEVLRVVNKSKYTNKEVKEQLHERITWLVFVRKFCKILIKFLKLDK